MFSPKLIPDTTRSGRCETPWSVTAHAIVSAGYPWTALAGKPPAVVTVVTVSVPGVVLEPVPLWFVRGATTVTFVSGSERRAWTAALIPGAPTPSSLVTRTWRTGTGAGALLDPALELHEVTNSPIPSTIGSAIQIWARLQTMISPTIVPPCAVTFLRCLPFFLSSKHRSSMPRFRVLTPELRPRSRKWARRPSLDGQLSSPVDQGAPYRCRFQVVLLAAASKECLLSARVTDRPIWASAPGAVEVLPVAVDRRVGRGRGGGSAGPP